MTNALTVARRELSQLFHSPLAYVFLILFAVVVQLPFVLVVFVQGQCDLRVFFDTLPWCLALFAALVTMRSWAEERQENTYEMLLTFPMREHQLVIGKFVAAFSFLLIGLAATLALPAMLWDLGRPSVHPDWGVVFSGYLGATLLAATWTAAGIFVSGLTRSQLLAAIVTVAFALFSLFLGTETVSSLLEARFQGLGSALETMLGSWSHYAAFEKGVVELADVAYFAAWTGAFLWLNALFVGLRRSPGSSGVFAVGTPLALGCAMLVGRLAADTTWARADLTEDGLYTLSPGTLRILSRAKVPVRVTFYVSSRDDMPREYQSLERQVMDRLQEISVASGGKLVARATHAKPENLIETDDAADEDPEKALAKAQDKQSSLERRLSAKGVKPFPVSTYGTTETSTKLIYSTLAVRYREKDEEYLQPIVPERLGDLEYLLANTVARIVRPRPPKIALYLGEEPMPPELKQMYMQNPQLKAQIPDPYAKVADLLRQEKFDVERVKLSAHEPMPPDYDALVVIGPSDLDDRQRWEIDRALAEGRPTLLAVQRYTWDYQRTERGISAKPSTADPGLDGILEAQGLGVSTDYLMDENQVELTIRSGGGGLQALFGIPVKLPTHVIVKPGSMNSDSVITQQASSIFFPWGTGLTLDEAKLAKNGLTVTKLFDSGPHSWTRAPADIQKLGRLAFAPPADGSFAPQPLAILVKGQFKSAFVGKDRPRWPMKMEDLMRDGRPQPAPPDPPPTDLHPAPGQLILLGGARLWQSEFLGALGNAPFLLNCLDALTLDEDLLLVRAKQPMDRRFDKPSDARARLWSLLPFGGAAGIFLAIGLGIWRARLRRRDAWESSHRRGA